MVSQTLRILSLGDSYTIGEAVLTDQRWPAQLASLLVEQGFSIEELKIIAQTGWTTGELLRAIDGHNIEGPFDFVSLLIGVNNQYRGLSLDSYRIEFRSLLEKAISFAGCVLGRVLVLSIPDWSVTPYAEGRDRPQIAAEIEHFNRINREETSQSRVLYLDVTQVSRRAADDPALLTVDGLHPSGKMYSQWVRLAFPIVLDALSG